MCKLLPVRRCTIGLTQSCISQGWLSNVGAEISLSRWFLGAASFGTIRGRRLACRTSSSSRSRLTPTLGTSTRFSRRTSNANEQNPCGISGSTCWPPLAGRLRWVCSSHPWCRRRPRGCFSLFGERAPSVRSLRPSGNGDGIGVNADCLPRTAQRPMTVFPTPVPGMTAAGHRNGHTVHAGTSEACQGIAATAASLRGSACTGPQRAGGALVMFCIPGEEGDSA